MSMCLLTDSSVNCRPNRLVRIQHMRERLLVLPVLMFCAACGGRSSSGTSNQLAVETSVIPTTTVSDTTTTAVRATVDDEIVRIEVTVGIDSGPDRIENVAVGRQIELTVMNPEDDDEFHVHGYDLGGDETAAGEEKVFAFTATEAGDFEVESHATGEVLVVIRVS